MKTSEGQMLRQCVTDVECGSGEACIPLRVVDPLMPTVRVCQPEDLQKNIAASYSAPTTAPTNAPNGISQMEN